MTEVKTSIAREIVATTPNAAEQKAELRKGLLALRSGISAQHRHGADSAIVTHLMAWQTQHLVGSLAVYWPIRGEPDLHDVFEALAQRGVQLALPVVSGADAPLTFAAWTPGQAMQRGTFGVAIPATPQRTVLPQAILLPCLGFNAARIRLGYGGGFYDRTLASLPTIITVGVAYHCCQLEFPAEPHDVALGSLITEHGFQ